MVTYSPDQRGHLTHTHQTSLAQRLFKLHFGSKFGYFLSWTRIEYPAKAPLSGPARSYIPDHVPFMWPAHRAHAVTLQPNL